MRNDKEMRYEGYWNSMRIDDGDDAQVGVDLPKGTGDHAVDPSAVADDSQPRHRHIWPSSPSGIIVRT